VIFINFSRTHSYANTRESGSKRICAISTGHPKFLVAFDNENLFVDPAAKGHFSGYVRLPKKFQHNPPAAIFASSIVIEKLINVEGLILVKLARVSIQVPKGCCTFQVSLVYNRVCCGFVWCGYGLFSFENGLRGLRDFPGHFSGSGRVLPAGFCVVLGLRELGEGRLGDKTKTRHFSGNLGCVGSQHP
jgi:hypothetical protein